MSLTDAVQNDDEDVVQGDKNLSRDERDVKLETNAAEREFLVYAAIPSVIRGLLTHERFEIGYVYAVTEQDGVRQVAGNNIEELYEAGELRSITAVKGTLPVGAVTIGKPRESDVPSRLVSTWEGDS